MSEPGRTDHSGHLPSYTEDLKDLVVCLRSQSQAGLLAPCDLTRQGSPAVREAQESLLAQGQCSPQRLQGSARFPGSPGDTDSEPEGMHSPGPSLPKSLQAPPPAPKSSDHQVRKRTRLPLSQLPQPALWATGLGHSIPSLQKITNHTRGPGDAVDRVPNGPKAQHSR